MALTFRQVRHFIATAETGRVSAAAAGLNVTQSAVTASIKALERTRLPSVQHFALIMLWYEPASDPGYDKDGEGRRGSN